MGVKLAPATSRVFRGPDDEIGTMPVPAERVLSAKGSIVVTSHGRIIDRRLVEGLDAKVRVLPFVRDRQRRHRSASGR